jgi:putative endonuclease
MTNKYNKVLYTGVTDDLLKRVLEHKNRLRDGFTKKYNADKLIYFEKIEGASKAFGQIKGWLRKKKIDLINLINPEWKDLS